MLVGAGDVPARLLLAGDAAGESAEHAAGEDAIRIRLRVPAGAVIGRREARPRIAVLVDRAIVEAKIVARDIAEGALLISGLQPELVAGREIIGVQLNAGLDREAVIVAGDGREGIGGRGKDAANSGRGDRRRSRGRSLRTGWRCSDARRPRSAPRPRADRSGSCRRCPGSATPPAGPGRRWPKCR